MSDPRASTEVPVDAHHWWPVLTRYRAPDPAHSVVEMIVTLAPFFATWAVAWWLLSSSAALAMLLALSNAALLVRLLMIQHDCGRKSLFRCKQLGSWLVRAFVVITLSDLTRARTDLANHHFRRTPS